MRMRGWRTKDEERAPEENVGIVCASQEIASSGAYLLASGQEQSPSLFEIGELCIVVVPSKAEGAINRW